MTYGRTIYKALDHFFIARSTWPPLAADRGAWRQTLRQGFPPKQFRRIPSAPLPPPIALTRPKRSTDATGIANYTVGNHFYTKH